MEFFRFEVVGGDAGLHDNEVDEVLILWMAGAIDMLSYPTEQEVVREAVSGPRAG